MAISIVNISIVIDFVNFVSHELQQVAEKE